MDVNKLGKPLSFEKALETEGELWALNRTDKKGRDKYAPLYIGIKAFGTNEPTRVVLPTTYPVPLTYQISKKTMENSTDLRNYVGEGLVELYSEQGFTEADIEQARKAVAKVVSRLDMKTSLNRSENKEKELQNINPISQLLNGNVADVIEKNNQINISENEVLPKVIDAVVGHQNGAYTEDDLVSKLEDCSLNNTDVSYIKANLGTNKKVMKLLKKLGHVSKEEFSDDE